MTNKMVYSLSGRHLTEQFEGCKLKAYKDSTGVWTIGYGHTSHVFEGMTCTEPQADLWLQCDITVAANVVNFYVTIQLSQHEFDALVDFTFNLGSGRLHTSTLLKLVNSGKFEEAAQEFEKWGKAGGVAVAGLMRRRIAERDEFLSKDAVNV